MAGVKLVKFAGFPWHQHEHEDEMFLFGAGDVD